MIDDLEGGRERERERKKEFRRFSDLALSRVIKQ